MMSMWRSSAPAYHVVELPPIKTRQPAQERVALHV
jgi:hypothetical protein